VAHFDAWAVTVAALEPAPDGAGYRMHIAFAKFINLSELPSMFRSVSDVQAMQLIDAVYASL
jgi:N12 class adenine-specific DNA methylase